METSQESLIKLDDIFQINKNSKNTLDIKFAGHKICQVVLYDDEVYFYFDKPLHAVFSDFMMSVSGETNIISRGNINIDSLKDLFGSVIHLNSREARQIRDFEESKLFRENKLTCNNNCLDCPCDNKCESVK